MEAGSFVWPMEARRLSLDDPLLECLAILAGAAGRRTTAAALSAGLPVHGQGLAPPSVFMRAAERVSMTARMVGYPVEDLLDGGNFPCILILRGEYACILKGVSAGGAQLVFPETPDSPVTVAVEELKRRYADYAFFVRPHAHFDGRAGAPPEERGRHWFWGAIWRHKRLYRDVVFAAVLVNMLALAMPLFSMNVYDRVVPNASFDTLWVLAAGVGISFILDLVLKSLRAQFVDVAGRKADAVISARILEQILGMRMTARPASVGVHASNLKEFESLREFFTSATIVALVDFPFILLFLVAIWGIAGAVAVVPLVAVPVALAVGAGLQKPLDRVTKETMRESAYKSGLVFEILSGLETIKAQGAESHIQRKWEELTEASARTAVKARTLSGFGVNFALFVANVSSVTMIVYGVYQIAAGSITMGALIAATTLLGRVMAPLASMASLLTRYSQSKEALQRLDELMKAPVERPARQSFVSMLSAKGRIEFRDVVFRYPGQKTPALNGVSFTVEPGEHVGIIGPVGSGKTTASRLILNLWQPESGSVLVDGVDVRQIDPADLRRNIGMVQQTPYLFYGTVRENITLGHESVPDALVLRAAEMAGVMNFLRDSELGLDTQVGERGENLSGGQRQSVAIARALLYDPPLLLLDEPTASIDPGSEKRLHACLKDVIRNKTVLLVTHRGDIIGLADKLILLDRGRIAATGASGDILRHLATGMQRGPGGADA